MPRCSRAAKFPSLAKLASPETTLIVVANERRQLEVRLPGMRDAEGEAHAMLRARVPLLTDDMSLECSEMDRHIVALTAVFLPRAGAEDAARRLYSIPGIGVLNATAP